MAREGGEIDMTPTTQQPVELTAEELKEARYCLQNADIAGHHAMSDLIDRGGEFKEEMNGQAFNAATRVLAEHVRRKVMEEREACAKHVIALGWMLDGNKDERIAEAIRSRR